MTYHIQRWEYATKQPEEIQTLVVCFVKYIRIQRRVKKNDSKNVRRVIITLSRKDSYPMNFHLEFNHGVFLEWYEVMINNHDRNSKQYFVKTFQIQNSLLACVSHSPSGFDKNIT